MEISIFIKLRAEHKYLPRPLARSTQALPAYTPQYRDIRQLLFGSRAPAPGFLPAAGGPANIFVTADDHFYWDPMVGEWHTRHSALPSLVEKILSGWLSLEQ